MFVNHLHPAADEWLHMYWGAAAPLAQAMEKAWLDSAVAFMPPPWNAMMRAAFAWRDLANSGYHTARAERAPGARADLGAWRWERGYARRPAPPMGIADAPAARPPAVSTEPAAMISYASSSGAADRAQRRGAHSVVLINTFVVPIAMEEPFLNWWRMLKPAFASQPGFISAKLHRSLDQNERYRFINIAVWESTDSYRAALTTMWSSVPKPTIAGLEWHPALYEVVEEA